MGKIYIHTNLWALPKHCFTVDLAFSDLALIASETCSAISQQLQHWLICGFSEGKKWDPFIQGGPLLVISGVITPINGLING